MSAFVECFDADIVFDDDVFEVDAVFQDCTLEVDMCMGILSGNYDDLENKPSIEQHTLIGDSTLEEIGVMNITPQSIDQLIYG